MWWMVVLAALLGYLIGSIPMGYLVIWFTKGKDIRQHGSGRTGGTNALRAGGLGAGALTMLGDMLKGYIAVGLTRLIAGPDVLATSLGSFIMALAAVAAVVGHNWSLYLGFKGGAGTAPNIGASLAFWPLSLVYLAPMVPIGLYVIGYASVTSMVIAGLIIITYVVRAALQADPNWWYAAYAVAAAVAIVWALRPNIKRLREGTERLIGPRARRSQGSNGEGGMSI